MRKYFPQAAAPADHEDLYAVPRLAKSLHLWLNTLGNAGRRVSDEQLFAELNASRVPIRDWMSRWQSMWRRINTLPMKYGIGTVIIRPPGNTDFVLYKMEEVHHG